MHLSPQRLPHLSPQRLVHLLQSCLLQLSQQWLPHLLQQCRVRLSLQRLVHLLHQRLVRQSQQQQQQQQRGAAMAHREPAAVAHVGGGRGDPSAAAMAIKGTHSRASAVGEAAPRHPRVLVPAAPQAGQQEGEEATSRPLALEQ